MNIKQPRDGKPAPTAIVNRIVNQRYGNLAAALLRRTSQDTRREELWAIVLDSKRAA